MGRIGILLWIPCMFAEAVPAAAQADSDSSALADDAFAREISCLARHQRLDELLREIGKSISVNLTVVGKHGARRVTVAIKSRPARDVLDAIAKTLDLNWTRGHDGYLLVQLLKDVPPEIAAERDRIISDTTRAVEQEKTSFVSELFLRQRLTDEEVQRLADEYPLVVGPSLKQAPYARLGVRSITWLSANQLDEIFTSPFGITLDKSFIIRTGGDLGTGMDRLRIAFSPRGNLVIMVFTPETPVDGRARTKIETAQF